MIACLIVAVLSAPPPPSVDVDRILYDDVSDPVYARRVVIAYLSRYCKTWTIDECARLHNGGPNGPRRRSTDGYTAKVNECYESSTLARNS